MVEPHYIEHAKLVTPDAIVPDTTVEIADGKIARVITGAGAAVVSDLPVSRRVDAHGAYLAPGFIDLHIHGVHRHLVDHGPEAMAAMSGILPRYGVTGWLPTVCPMKPGDDARFIASLAAAGGGVAGARPLGLHLEGPFLTLTGALPPEALGQADARRVEALIAAAQPYRLTFSIAPDFKEIVPLIRLMARSGAPIFMTHTHASVTETQAAIEAGARHATHFYDVFPWPDTTEPGVRPCGAVEAILADPRVSVDFILDGTHVDPVAVRMALQCKGPDRVCLITDAMIGAGLPPGRHRFGDTDVVFSAPGAPARMAENSRSPGGLAGSGLTMNLAVRNAVKLAGIGLPQAVRMAGANPAQVLGLAASKGRIAPGYDADLVLLDDNFDVLRTWVAGKTVFRKE
ncbi:MAG: N-acetylglucosamine-6-phosphate deacetylase [Kiritimatiellae bacterium]|nr:N-acetylglucosamine-6-phosphate deacetylase [Kiritimatiellia bacterium]